MEMCTLSLNPEEKLLSFIQEEPSEEDIRDYWSGEGHLIFTVISYDPDAYAWSKYEIDWEDYSGCVGGLDETLGIQYALNEGILDVGKLKLGWTYEVNGITVVWTRGDGWTTDDDVDYYVEGEIYKRIYLSRWLSAWWWHLIGWRIRNARTKARTALSNYWKSYRDRSNDHRK